MSYELALTVAPTTEPVTTAEAKSFLRVDTTDDDTLIDSLVKTARQEVERFLNRQLITATWTLFLDKFPEERIRLPYPPVQSISSIYYVDTDGNQTLWDSSNYDFFVHDDGAYIEPVYGGTFPSTRAQSQAVAISYVAGYGASGSSVPNAILTAIKIFVAFLYENREGVNLRGQSIEMPLAVQSLLYPYRVFEVYP